MPTKLTELSLTASGGSLPSVRSSAPALPLTDRFDQPSPETLQVASRLRAVLNGEERIIVVAGLEARDGAPALARMLAVSLARVSRAKVALVDGDAHAAPLTSGCDTALEPGFSDLSAGDRPLDETVLSQIAADVTLIPAGDPGKTLNAPGCIRALSALSQQYAYVVVAAPPFHMGPDAVTLVSVSHGVVLSMAPGRRRKPEVRAFQQELARFGVRLLGAVLVESGR